MFRKIYKLFKTFKIQASQSDRPNLTLARMRNFASAANPNICDISGGLINIVIIEKEVQNNDGKPTDVLGEPGDQAS